MKVQSLINTDEGEFEFRGFLSDDELKLVISVGLNTLVKLGALPFSEAMTDRTYIERETFKEN